MAVPLDEPRNGQAALEIENPGVRTDEALHMLVVAQGHDPVLQHRQGLDFGLLFVQGDDFSVEQDQAGRLGMGCTTAAASHDQGGEKHGETPVSQAIRHHGMAPGPQGKHALTTSSTQKGEYVLACLNLCDSLVSIWPILMGVHRGTEEEGKSDQEEKAG